MSRVQPLLSNSFTLSSFKEMKNAFNFLHDVTVLPPLRSSLRRWFHTLLVQHEVCRTEGLQKRRRFPDCFDDGHAYRNIAPRNL
jgi:hypothetical protein